MTSVVTGRVQTLGTTLVINIELVNTRDGSQLWGSRFRTEFSNIFDVQDEIAAQISDQLRLQLSPSEKKRLVHRATKKSEAYELYLKGRFHANKRTIQGLERAIREFEKAIEVDPNYALAYSGLADCYTILAGRFLAPPDEAYPHAAAVAAKAIELDPDLAEPHATLAVIALFYKWNWTEADSEFKRAITLDPNYATAHHWYSLFLNCMDRREDALREARTAIELEPLSLLMNCHYADILYFDGRYDEALEHVKKSLEIENYFLAHLLIGRIYLEQGRHEEAVASIQRSIAMEGRYPELLATLAHAYGRLGKTEEAKRILDELIELGRTQFVAPSFLAEVHLAIGNVARAMKYAEEFFKMRGEIVDLVSGPRYKALREDRRWQTMLQRVGFPDRLALKSPAYAPTASL